MGSQRKPSVARRPRSPLPRQQTVREKLKNVQRKPMTVVPPPTPPTAPRTPGNGGVLDATPAARTRPMYAFSRGYFRVQ